MEFGFNRTWFTRANTVDVHRLHDDDNNRQIIGLCKYCVSKFVFLVVLVVAALYSVRKLL